jgi:hypothetical protein
MNHGHKMYCLMNSGRHPITRQLADALLLNAIDMFDENRRVQRIKSRLYDGVIESTLEVIEYADVPSVQFEALVSTDKFESATIRFIVRVDDLDGIELGEWQQLEFRVMGPVPFHELPPEIQEQIRSQGCEESEE